jgi:hypothetical protein
MTPLVDPPTRQVFPRAEIDVDGSPFEEEV